MKVQDVISQKVALENLAQKKKLEKESPASLKNAVLDKNDKFEFEKKTNQDVARVAQVQQSYQRNSVSMLGLSDMQKKVDEFEKTARPEQDYQNLSRELKTIASQVKYNGESIISFLSTSISDDKSLYTFKANLKNEIDSVQNKLAVERKNIATYLVAQENRDTVRDFSTDKTLNVIKGAIDKESAANLYKGISKLSTLLGS